MRACPFCNFDEGWVKTRTEDNEFVYRVECVVCGSNGPDAKTHEGAIEKWEGKLKDVDNDEDMKRILDEDLGGVSAPMATVVNTPGVGNAVPAPSANLNTDGPSGSGDKWTTDSSAKLQTNESNLNPYDQIGAMIAKKMGVIQPFKKKDSKTNTVQQKNFNISTLDSYMKATAHVPDHPLTSKKKKTKKKVNEGESLRDEASLKDIHAKTILRQLSIPFEYHAGKSDIYRTFINEPMKNGTYFLRRVVSMSK